MREPSITGLACTSTTVGSEAHMASGRDNLRGGPRSGQFRTHREQLRTLQHADELPRSEGAVSSVGSIALRAKHWSMGGNAFDPDVPCHPRAARSIASLEDIFSLALLAESSSRGAARRFSVFALTLIRGTAHARLEVRDDARAGWRRLERFAQSNATGTQAGTGRFPSADLPESEHDWNALVQGLHQRRDLVSARSDAQVLRAHRIDQLWSQLSNLQVPSTSRHTSRLEEHDVRLALAWARDSLGQERGRWLEELLRGTWPEVRSRLSTLKPDDKAGIFWPIERCLSARCAELYVRDVRRAAGERVEDLSILQLKAPADARWHLADLDVDGVLVDVKNVRYSAAGTKQTWPLIKRFKTTRAGTPVLYDGVGSSFKSSLRDHLDGADKPVTYYGTASENRLAELEGLGEGTIRVVLRRNTSFGIQLADWCFELQHRTSPDVLAAVDELATLYESAPEEVAGLEPAKRAILRSRIPIETERHGRREAASVVQGVDYLADLVRENGRSPAVLAVGMMNLFSRWASRGGPFTFLSDASAIFQFGARFPLGVYDPGFAVSQLHNTLSTLEAFLAERPRFVAVELVGPMWLRARMQNGATETLFVYCGECGAFPLVHGPCKVCPHETGRLVCEECGFCCRQKTRDARPSPW